jgi:HPt (histidine-containing phosphotransfer) domain-containing protein
MEPRPDAQPPSIPGIDSLELLERIGEDLDLFWDVLGEFSTAYRDTPAQIAAALGQDPDRAKELAHTLKGVLGNLAATDLFAACKALDDAIRERRTEAYPALLASLEQGVPALCDAIASARGAVSGGNRQPGPGVDPVWLAGRYAALRTALQGHRARDCKALADEIAAGSLPAAEQPFFDQLHALVRVYRFQDAHDLLARRLDV